MYIDIDDNDHCQVFGNSFCSEAYLPSSKIFALLQDNLAQIEVEFNLFENQIENQAAEISSSPIRTQNRFDQPYSLHSQVDDDWEKMYLDDDGIFIVSICQFTIQIVRMA